MKLQISTVADKGLLNKERIILKVLVDANVGDFVLMQTGFAANDVTIGVEHAFWFPYKPVSSGDLIVIYTKTGNDSQKLIDGSRTAHFYYWGLTFTIWDREGRAAVLLHAPVWEYKKTNDL